RRFARRVLTERTSKPAWMAAEAAAGDAVADRRVNGIEIADLITEGQKREFKTAEARDRYLLELLWLAQSIQKGPFASEVTDLVRTLLRSETPEIRAAATRVLSLELAQFPDALSLLTGLASDSYPRVRLEAVRGLGSIPKVEAAVAALKVLEQPMDKFLNYALLLTVDELEPVWSAALKSGELKFDDATKLEYLVTAAPSQEVVAVVSKLVHDQTLTEERRNRMLAVLAGVGGAPELALVFERATKAAHAKEDAAAPLLDALTQAVRRRKAQPAGDPAARWAELSEIIQNGTEPLRISAIRLAGAWKNPAAGASLAAAAHNDASTPGVSTAALEALAELGGPEASQQLVSIAKAGPAARRARAASALAALDLGQAAPAAAALLAEANPTEYDPAALVAALVRTKDGPATLAKALEGKSVNADVAKLAVRTAASAGDSAKPLEQALRRAGKLDDPRPLPTPQEVAALVAEAKASGDPVRGEAIFRRKNLQCLQCHAVGGAGGRVGPDITTIGASAQPDYLVDSLLDPNKQVKENYNAIICETTDGRVITGLKVRQNDQELIIRNAEDKDVVIPAEDVDSVTVGKSLMPAGLIDPLTRGELVDLVRFLSELGKPGPFGPAPSPVVRRWRVLENTPEARSVAREAPSYAEAGNDPRLTWSNVYSQVSGELPVAELATAGPWFDTKQFTWLQADVEVETAGAIAVKLNSPEGLRIFLDGKPTDAAKLGSVELTQGRHVLTFAVDRGSRPEPLRVEVAAATGSSARVVPVGGK
ncbi:MAG TPA: HEAT repeat domain-containing protein, partial [Pirellulales bacterium]